MLKCGKRDAQTWSNVGAVGKTRSQRLHIIVAVYLRQQLFFAYQL